MEKTTGMVRYVRCFHLLSFFFTGVICDYFQSSLWETRLWIYDKNNELSDSSQRDYNYIMFAVFGLDVTWDVTRDVTCDVQFIGRKISWLIIISYQVSSEVKNWFTDSLHQADLLPPEILAECFNSVLHSTAESRMLIGQKISKTTFLQNRHVDL